MENKEMIFDAVGMISGRHIEEARSYEEKKAEGRRFAIRLAYAAAACLLLFAAGVGTSHTISSMEKKSNGAVATLPTANAEQTVLPTEEPRIVYYNGPKIIEPSDIPPRGEVRISEALCEMMENKENEGCMFAVTIDVYGNDCDAVRAFWEGRKAEKARLLSEPEIIAEFMADVRELDQKYTDMGYPDIDWDNATDEQYSRVDELLYLPDMTDYELKYYNGDRETILMHRVYKIWAESKPAEVLESFLEAKKQIDELYFRRNFLIEDELGRHEADIILLEEAKEYERLKTMYPVVELEEGVFYFLLSREQINGLPFKSEFGYNLIAKSEAGIVFQTS